ncbi:MAG: nicotine adenine dinucleotide glycohydrolase [Treponema sp.]|nr:nicotine adenine dinucleotide glycohydrolase [Treponema sp.]
MKKLISTFLLSIAAITFVFAADDDNWFMAQTKTAPVASINSTSELVEAQYDGKYLYPPINILDGDTTTTWCEDEKNGPGIGESITIEFTIPVSFDEIQFINGFATKDYYLKNNRVKTIQITQVAKKHFQQKSYVLKDNCETYQSIKFPLTQTAQTITLKIVDVYKGNKYDDTCLDEFRILYKGKVIPFTGVKELKETQTENSKQMLKTTSKDFKKDFEKLFSQTTNDGYDYKELILIADNKKDGVYFRAHKENGEFYVSMFYNAKITKKPSSANDLAKLNPNEEINFNFENFDKSSASKVFYYTYPSNWYINMRFKLGNYRITTEKTVSYVTTETTTIIKLDGNSVYINGVHYTVADPDEYLIVEFDTGM